VRAHQLGEANPAFDGARRPPRPGERGKENAQKDRDDADDDEELDKREAPD